MPHTHTLTNSKGSYLHFLLKRVINLIDGPDVLHHSIFVKEISTAERSRAHQSKNTTQVPTSRSPSCLKQSDAVFLKGIFFHTGKKKY